MASTLFIENRNPASVSCRYSALGVDFTIGARSVISLIAPVAFVRARPLHDDTLTRFVADRRKLLVLDTRSMIVLSRTDLDRLSAFAYDRPRLGEMQRYVARQSPPPRRATIRPQVRPTAPPEPPWTRWR